MNKKVFYKILIHGFLIAMAVITLMLAALRPKLEGGAAHE